MRGTDVYETGVVCLIMEMDETDLIRVGVIELFRA